MKYFVITFAFLSSLLFAKAGILELTPLMDNGSFCSVVELLEREEQNEKFCKIKFVLNSESVQCFLAQDGVDKFTWWGSKLLTMVPEGSYDFTAECVGCKTINKKIDITGELTMIEFIVIERGNDLPRALQKQMNEYQKSLNFPQGKPGDFKKGSDLAPSEDAAKNKVDTKVSQNENINNEDSQRNYKEKKVVIKEEIKQEKKAEAKREEEKKTFTFVEEMPSFPGGTGQMMNFFAKNINYPDIAKRAGIEGRIFVQFTVNNNGTISDPAIIKGIGGDCDQEAVRVVMTMPRWLPGRQNGEAVNVRVSIPIVFKLN